MPNITPTKYVLALSDALTKRGVVHELEHWDGFKHLDIYIPRDSLYIELDGTHHVTNPDRMIADFNRDYFSFKDGFFTKHITNEAIDTHLEQIADAIAHIDRNAPNKLGEKVHI